MFAFVKEDLIHENKSLEKEIRNLIIAKLPSHYEPKRIIFLKNNDLPLNEHGMVVLLKIFFLYFILRFILFEGKIDFKKFERIYLNETGPYLY